MLSSGITSSPKRTRSPPPVARGGVGGITTKFKSSDSDLDSTMSWHSSSKSKKYTAPPMKRNATSTSWWKQQFQSRPIAFTSCFIFIILVCIFFGRLLPSFQQQHQLSWSTWIHDPFHGVFGKNLSHATFRVVSPSSTSASSGSTARQTNTPWTRFDAMLQDAKQQGISISHQIYTPEEQRIYLQRHGSFCYRGMMMGKQNSRSSTSTNVVLERYDNLPTESLKEQLWKYCILYKGTGNLYLDLSDIMFLQSLPEFLQAVTTSKDNTRTSSSSRGSSSVALRVDTEHLWDKENDKDDDGNNGMMMHADPMVPVLVHSSFIYFANRVPSVAKNMVQLLVETSNQVLLSSPLLLARQLHEYMEQDKKANQWTLWPSTCRDLADAAGGKDATSHERIDVVANEGQTAGIDGSDAAEAAETSSSDGQHKKPQLAIGLHVQQNSQTSLIATSVTPLAQTRRLHQTCPIRGGYCCQILHPSNSQGGGSGGHLPLLALKNPIGINLQATSSTTTRDNHPDDHQQHPSRLPFAVEAKQHKNHPAVIGGVPSSDLSFISTIRAVRMLPTLPSSSSFSSSSPFHHYHNQDEEMQRLQQYMTPNFFDILFENDCLPTQKACHKCLKSTRNGHGSCQGCVKECSCYCSVLCKVRPPPKRVVKEYQVFLPEYRKDESRLIPRIVHQTWYEPVSKEKYPNMSRLVESWRKSGWTYHFYDDDTMAEFLSTHFPPEVREAYDAINPGAFKADLFRYCVLLIRGGVYADMDVLLQANLDEAIAPDVGFMVPIDEPGIAVGHRSCLWNGLLAVAPGHPFLAKTIEIVVNNIRNRFTSVDYDDMLCPNPVLSVSHNVDMLFTCGPCILGAGINEVLGRHMQHAYEIGDVDIWSNERQQEQSSNSSPLEGRGDRVVVEPDDPRLLIPGRTVILQQNKHDMGAHRFTWVERNLLVAATDMPDYDDRPPTKEHYSKTHEKEGIYGLKKLYKTNVRANEEIRVRVVQS